MDLLSSSSLDAADVGRYNTVPGFSPPSRGFRSEPTQESSRHRPAGHAAIRKCPYTTPDAAAPIHTLPPEILSLIFVTAQGMFDPYSLNASCFPLRYPNFGAVWPFALLSYGRLYFSPPWRLDSDMIARYLDRPGSYPIDLSLSTVTQTKRFSFLDVDRLYDLLLPYLPRCRMISVTGDRGTDPTVLGLLNMFS
jgi:hypothetical protein